MKQHLTPCAINCNSAKLCAELENLGYKRSETFNEECQSIFTTETRYYSSNIPNLGPESYGKTILPYGIICHDNVELFLAIAALSDEDDICQWFVDKRGHFFQCRRRKIADFITEAEICGFNVGGDWFHKASVDELIEHFKNTNE